MSLYDFGVSFKICILFAGSGGLCGRDEHVGDASERRNHYYDRFATPLDNLLDRSQALYSSDGRAAKLQNFHFIKVYSKLCVNIITSIVCKGNQFPLISLGIYA